MTSLISSKCNPETMEELLVYRDQREQEAGISFDEALDRLKATIIALRTRLLEPWVQLRPIVSVDILEAPVQSQPRWLQIRTRLVIASEVHTLLIYGYIDRWSGNLHRQLFPALAEPSGNIFDNPCPCIGTYRMH